MQWVGHFIKSNEGTALNLCTSDLVLRKINWSEIVGGKCVSFEVKAKLHNNN